VPVHADRAVKNEDERVAEELRIPGGTPGNPHASADKSAGFPSRSSGASPRVSGVPFEALEKFVGQPVLTFYRNAICGGLMVGLTGGTSAGTAVVPMAFQSALAGIMLAADLVKHAAGLPAAFDYHGRGSICCDRSRLSWATRGRRIRAAAALCCDRDFLDSYRRKYETRHLSRRN